MQKIIEMCTRVEGHGDVKFLVQNDEISEVEFEISAFRGFEHILVGKKLIDLPKIVSRICGLCHASQTIASCKSIESMYNIKANPQSVLIRRLLLTGELLKSHIMHYFFQALPDLMNIFDLYEKKMDFPQLINYNPQLTSNVYDLIKIGNEIDRIFGGRAIHTITPILGGVLYKPIRKNLNLAEKYFIKAIDNLGWIIDHFINQFSKLRPPIDLTLPKVNYMALNNNRIYDRYEGLLSIRKSLSKYQDLQLEEYSQYFDKDSALRGIDFVEKEKSYIVGPLARNNIVEGYGIDEVAKLLSFFDKNWKTNILFSSFIRLVEMLVESKKALDILNDSLLKTILPLPNLKEINNLNGFGTVEAPRGILIHHYRINRRDILEEAKLFIPTEINIPLINKMLKEYAQKLYEKEDLTSIKKKVQIIVRAFDPCISCATH
jgi:coenzyme F420-reducing hydrogenase alpha subunit